MIVHSNLKKRYVCQKKTHITKDYQSENSKAIREINFVKDEGKEVKDEYSANYIFDICNVLSGKKQEPHKIDALI